LHPFVVGHLAMRIADSDLGANFTYGDGTLIDLLAVLLDIVTDGRRTHH
jgi:hypothetical protein